MNSRVATSTGKIQRSALPIQRLDADHLAAPRIRLGTQGTPSGQSDRRPAETSSRIQRAAGSGVRADVAVGVPVEHPIARAFGVIQREVVAQVGMREHDSERDNDMEIDDATRLRVQSVVISGRPPKTYTGSMGDHSTAWSVHIAALQHRLIGKRLDEAIAELDGMAKAMTGLAGTQLVQGLVGRQKQLHDDAQVRLAGTQARVGAAQGAGSNDVVSLLQEYIAAYLEARETVPLSTINVAASSQGTAGKAKNESTRDMLDLATAGGKKDKTFPMAFRMFDAKAVLWVAAMPNASELAAVAPGVGPETRPEGRIRLYARQHAQAMCHYFPTLFHVTGNAEAAQPMDVDEGADEPDVREPVEQLEEYLYDKTMLLLPAKFQASVKALEDRRDACFKAGNLASATKRKGELAELRKYAGLPEPVTSDGDQEPKRRARAKPAKDRDLGYSEPKKRSRDQVAEAAGPQPGAADVDSNAVANGGVGGDDQPMMVDEPLGGGDNDRNDVGEAEFDSRDDGELHDDRGGKLSRIDDGPESFEVDLSQLGTLAVQLVLIRGENVVQAVRVEGRARPQHGGSHGAHATAWVLHVVEMRRAVVGAPLDEIPARLAAIESRAATAAASKTKTSPRDPLKEDVDTTRVDAVQQRIAVHLAYIDTLPGSSHEAADTGGHGEPWHKKVLEEFKEAKDDMTEKRVEPPAVFNAICGMCDVASLVQDGADGVDAARRLATAHIDHIEDLYPGALEYTGRPAADVIATILTQADGDDYRE